MVKNVSPLMGRGGALAVATMSRNKPRNFVNKVFGLGITIWVQGHSKNALILTTVSFLSSKQLNA